MKKTKYCIDTSSILDAWDRHYPPGSFPSFWKKVDELIAEKRLFSPNQVKQELGKKEDELKKWSSDRPVLFVPESLDQARKVRMILKQFETFVDSSKGRSGGDPWVIALAMVEGYVVVSQEVPKTMRKPKIPNVCDFYNVQHLPLVQLIKDEKWIF